MDCAEKRLIVTGALLAGTVGTGLVVLVVIGCLQYPEWRRRKLEVGAITALRQLVRAQECFRDEDLDGDGRTDYGTLDELADAGLIDARPVPGYRLDHRRAPSGERFMVVANPLKPGMRAIALTSGGGIGTGFNAGLLLCNDECVLPRNCLPVSR